jgi:hypothetical protein
MPIVNKRKGDQKRLSPLPWNLLFKLSKLSYDINYKNNALHTSAARLLVHEGLYSQVPKYFGTCLKMRRWRLSVKIKK